MTSPQVLWRLSCRISVFPFRLFRYRFSKFPSSWQFQSCGRSTLHWCWPSQLKLLSYALPNSEPSLAFGPEHKHRIVNSAASHNPFNSLEKHTPSDSENKKSTGNWMFNVLFVGKFEKDLMFPHCFHIDILCHSVPISMFSWFSFRILSDLFGLHGFGRGSCGVAELFLQCTLRGLQRSRDLTSPRDQEIDSKILRSQQLLKTTGTCWWLRFVLHISFLYTPCDSSSLSESCFKWLNSCLLMLYMFFFSSLIWICWSHVESICRVRTSSLCASRDLVSSHKAWTRLSMPQEWDAFGTRVITGVNSSLCFLCAILHLASNLPL